MKPELKSISSIKPAVQRPNDPESDFKAEVIAAFLIEQGYNPQQIAIIRDGMARRGFSTEVNDVEKKYSLQEQEEYLYIKANKESLYDMLPKGLFHQPVHRKKFIKDKEDALEEIKIHREEEFYARKFFQPLEVVSDAVLTEAYLYEARFNKKISQGEFIDLFTSYWPVLKQLRRTQANYFMYIMPILHQIRTDRAEVEEAMSVLLEVPVRITNIKLPAKKADSYYESFLGKNEMGVNLVLGSCFDDGEYDLKVTLGPMPANKMLNFLKTAKGYILLEALCNIFLPVGAFVEYDFKILQEDSLFVLSGEEQNSFLGINTFI